VFLWPNCILHWCVEGSGIPWGDSHSLLLWECVCTKASLQ
jgi:hypothetical protein